MTDRSRAGAGAGRGRTGPPGYPPGYPPPADSCSPDQRIALGSYSLGALDPAEADQVRMHLVDCAACRAEYRELAAVPAVLARITETEMAAGPVPPDGELLTRLLAKAAAREASGRTVPAPATPGAGAAAAAYTGGFGEAAADSEYARSPGLAAGHSGRARRHRPARQRSGFLAGLWSGSLMRRVSIAAAGGVLAAVAVIGVYAGTGGSKTPVAFGNTITATNAAMNISGTVQYHATDWGSWVQVTMHNVPPGDDCMLLALDGKGNRVVASTWWAPSSGTATIPGGVAMQADEITRFQVVTATGKTLLEVPVH